MKLYYIATLYVFLILTQNRILSQVVPNGNMENWVNVIGLFENPEYWKTNNSSEGISVAKSTDAYSGNYALRISSTAIGIDGPTDGVARLMYTPVSVGGYAMYVKVDSIAETGSASVQILGFTNGSPKGYGSWESTTETIEFERIEIPVIPEGIYDSIQIYCSASTATNSLGQQLGHARFLLDEITEMPLSGLSDHIDQESDPLRIYPNPVADLLIIAKKNSEPMSYQIFSIKGELIHEGIAENELNFLNTQHWVEGIYLMKGVNQRGTIPTSCFPFMVLH
ncbi:MAG: T9SS type A sorting domain-containing protein [Bacteroidetes bacterium]|nr:MAG: T9SS type A sorting domain-containing protein [Bacteroidota bacterium]